MYARRVVVRISFLVSSNSEINCGEFADNGGCEQLMTPTTDGNCRCACADGFVLNSDGRTCDSGQYSSTLLCHICYCRNCQLEYTEVLLLRLLTDSYCIFCSLLRNKISLIIINMCSMELKWDGKITKIWYDNEMRRIRITVWNGGDL